MKRREKGSAAIVVELRRGVITVRRRDNADLLLKVDAYEGDWERVWEGFSALGRCPISKGSA
jgi:hypothetical protein